MSSPPSAAPMQGPLEVPYITITVVRWFRVFQKQLFVGELNLPQNWASYKAPAVTWTCLATRNCFAFQQDSRKFVLFFAGKLLTDSLGPIKNRATQAM